MAEEQPLDPLLLAGHEQFHTILVLIVGGLAPQVYRHLDADGVQVFLLQLGDDVAEAFGGPDFADGMEVGAGVVLQHGGHDAGMGGHLPGGVLMGLVAEALGVAGALADVAQGPVEGDLGEIEIVVHCS